jgi:hypothetical protein
MLKCLMLVAAEANPLTELWYYFSCYEISGKSDTQQHPYLSAHVDLEFGATLGEKVVRLEN